MSRSDFGPKSLTIRGVKMPADKKTVISLLPFARKKVLKQTSIFLLLKHFMFDVCEKRVSQKLRIRKNYLFDKNE
jgi:hypothetical protein